jgi:hypothetical protein
MAEWEEKDESSLGGLIGLGDADDTTLSKLSLQRQIVAA